MSEVTLHDILEDGHYINEIGNGQFTGGVYSDLIYRLRKRAEIRRSIQSRKSVQEGNPDRLADLLDEAAKAISDLTKGINQNE